MAFPYYAPGRAPQYQEGFYAASPQWKPRYSRPPTPDSAEEQRKLRKRQQRWSFPGFANRPHEYPLTPPPTPIKVHRVLWEADFMRAPVSTHYPTLHPVLATDTTRVQFDVRVPPAKGMDPRTYRRFWNESAVAGRPTMHMRLISSEFPWVFELDYRPLAAKGTPHYVTCGDVWTALTSGLSQPVTDAEWSILVTTNRSENIKRKKIMTEIVAVRKYDEGKYARRADWLGQNIIFRGLAKDDNFARSVLLPGREPCSDTCVVKFAAIRM